MKNNRCVIMVEVCAFGLSLAVCFLVALYVRDSVGDGIFALSFNNEAAVFGKRDIDFLTKENYYFTFEARREAEGATKTAKARVEVVGTNANYASITGIKAVSGSFFNDIHGKKLSNTVVLNSAAAWCFFGNTNCIGNTIRIDGKQYQIAGVFENSLENSETMRIFLPFEVLDKELPDCDVYEILIASEGISAVESLIKVMGYSPNGFQILDLEQYKNIMMQRARIIIFLCGVGVIVYIARMCLLNIKAIAGEAKAFGQSNYATDMWLLIKKKSFLHEAFLLVGKLLLIFLTINIVKFKLCLPYYFFSMSELSYTTMVDLLRFFIQPYVSIPVLGYLNGLNLISNIMFFTSILLGTIVLSVRLAKY